MQTDTATPTVTPQPRDAASAPAQAGYPREVDRLSTERFDVLVVGAGVYGAWTALDAARRWLRVALIERGDFASATSANSQKILHGGFRYLQHADFKRMRESIRERSAVMRLMPHLVEPQRFLVPTTPKGVQRKPLMRVALKMNDLISFDRNRGLAESKRLGPGQVLSKAECLAQAPGLDPDDVTGGIVFQDGQITNSERLTLAVVRSAMDAGAVAVNYLRADGYLRDDPAEPARVTGVRAIDAHSGGAVEVRAAVTVNCTGPWTAGALRAAGLRDNDRPVKEPYDIFRAVVLATRNVLDGPAVAVKGKAPFQDRHEVLSKGYRNFFVTRWHHLSLVGTYYEPYAGDPSSLSVSADDIRRYVDEFNAAYTTARLSYEDVKWVYAGLLPLAEGADPNDPQYQKQYRILDHGRDHGTPGLFTVVGVKWTTARDVAEKTVDQIAAQAKPGQPLPPGQTLNDPPAGGRYDEYEDFVNRAVRDRPDTLSETSMRHLIETYGETYPEVLRHAERDAALAEPLAEGCPVIGAQMVHAAAAEMAQTLGDAVFRRTPLGLFGWPGEAVLRRCAALMAPHLGWDDQAQHQQVEAVRETYAQLGVPHTEGADGGVEGEPGGGPGGGSGGSE